MSRKFNFEIEDSLLDSSIIEDIILKKLEEWNVPRDQVSVCYLGPLGTKHHYLLSEKKCPVCS